jgi:hypothetical protein
MGHKRASAGPGLGEKKLIVRDDCTISSREPVFFKNKKNKKKSQYLCNPKDQGASNVQVVRKDEYSGGSLMQKNWNLRGL